MGPKKLPDGWLDYSKIGEQVAGTRFIAFKVPLKRTICQNKLQPEEWFTTADVMQAVPNLKLIVNLTNTIDGRYYDYKDFKTKGIDILLLKCAGQGTLPPQNIMDRFFHAVDAFVSATATAADNDGVIGVHCTHGLNRTGYFICRYMIERMGIPVDNALQLFETARGHPIERQQYVKALKQQIESTPPKTNWGAKKPGYYRDPYTIPSRDNYKQTGNYDCRRGYGENFKSHPYQRDSYSSTYRRNAGPKRNHEQDYSSNFGSKRRNGTVGYGSNLVSEQSFASRGRHAPKLPRYNNRQTDYYDKYRQ